MITIKKNNGSSINKYLSRLKKQPARLRRKKAVRAMLQEHQLRATDLVMPLFITEDSKEKEISSMPGVFCWHLNGLLRECEILLKLKIPAIAMFPYIRRSLKDEFANEALNTKNFYLKAIRKIKQEFPQIIIFSDVALDPYSSIGHDGIMQQVNGDLLVDLPASLKTLAEMALLQAEMGADFIAPSDMLDGRIGYIRQELDKNGFSHVGIMSYAVKFASSLYQPFREALDSQPIGDKRTYQMNPANIREALRETQLDEREGADMLMIKPTLSYLDVVSQVKETTHLPIGGYHVSGEYALLQLAKEITEIDTNQLLHEQMLCMKRAGVDFIFTYCAKKIGKQLANHSDS